MIKIAASSMRTNPPSKVSFLQCFLIHEINLWKPDGKVKHLGSNYSSVRYRLAFLEMFRT